MKKGLIITIVIGVLLILCLGGYYLLKESDPTDAIKFSEEYPSVSKDNVFVYRDIDEIINILKSGTGVVYLGFDECSWCQAYVPILNEAAKETGIEKIYYYDILDARKDHTDKYQEILNIIGDHLQYDDEGNPRVYVPDVSVVKNGAMIEHDYEASKDTLGIEDPSEYWTVDRKEALKTKLKTAMEQIVNEKCNTCN